jgi:TPR repeat protein
MGVLYRNGKGVGLDYPEAVKWLKKASDQGVADAQIELAGCFSKGQGVKTSNAEAAKWILRAAKQGEGKAQLWLAICYERGEGVPQDFVEAYKWANLAAAQGVSQAQEFRLDFAKEMTSQMIAEGQRRTSAFVAIKEYDDGPIQ